MEEPDSVRDIWWGKVNIKLEEAGAWISGLGAFCGSFGQGDPRIAKASALA